MEHAIFLEGTRVSACWNVSHRGTVSPEITLSDCMWWSTEITVISSLNLFSRLIPLYEIYMESTFVRFHFIDGNIREIGERVRKRGFHPGGKFFDFSSLFPYPDRYASVDKKDASLRGISIESKCTTTVVVLTDGFGERRTKASLRATRTLLIKYMQATARLVGAVVPYKNKKWPRKAVVCR